MTYYVRFECSPYHPNQEMRNWIIENDVTLHSVRDAGMYGNRDVYYSSPTLTGGHVRIGHGYDSKFSNTVFHHTDPTDSSFFSGE